MGQILSSIFRFMRNWCCCLEQDGTETPNKHSFLLHIPTPDLLDHSNDTSVSKLHQNLSATAKSTCTDGDTEEENTQDSAYFLDVDAADDVLDVEEPDLLSDNTNSCFELVASTTSTTTSTCIDIVEDNWQNSAYVLDVIDTLEERWIHHYCSSHKMLLVGEGDFSFSASLARAFGSATNMVATSLDSRGFLYRNYKKAMSNIHELRTRGCIVLHGVDATEMANHCFLGGTKFDRVIYNFPHAGFLSDEPGESQKRRHQLLIRLFFKNAKEMIKESGEIHVTHKSNGFFLDWNIKGLAFKVGLRFIQEAPFSFTDYPGYRTKYGFGGDKNFNSNPSKTYKFGRILSTPT